MDDIKEIMGNAKHSSMAPKPKNKIRAYEFYNEETKKYDEPSLPPKGGVDQGINKKSSDNYGPLKKAIGADEKAKIKNMQKGGSVKSASARADGCCVRGKTRA